MVLRSWPRYSRQACERQNIAGILHSKGESSGSDDLYKTGFSNGAATIWQRLTPLENLHLPTNARLTGTSKQIFQRPEMRCTVHFSWMQLQQLSSHTLCAFTTAATLISRTVCSYSREEAESIDAEGRCVVTDNHVFVLFNLYGPAISSEENAADRFAYKLQFYKVPLQAANRAPWSSKGKRLTREYQVTTLNIHRSVEVLRTSVQALPFAGMSNSLFCSACCSGF